MVGGSILANPFFSFFYHPCHHSWGRLEGVWLFWRSASWRLRLSLSRFYVAFVLVATTFATRPTGDGTPEVIPMVHCFSFFGMPMSFQLRHATTAMIAVRGMTRPPPCH